MDECNPWSGPTSAALGPAASSCSFTHLSLFFLAALAFLASRVMTSFQGLGPGRHYGKEGYLLNGGIGVS